MQIKTKIVSCHMAYSKPVKREANGTVILPPLVFPVSINSICISVRINQLPFLIKILFSINLKHSSFGPSADANPVSNELVHAMP
jgi:hypothetical protein